VPGDPPPPSRRFEILERRRLHDGFAALDLVKLRHERFDGGWSPPLERELWCQRAAVVILPYDPVSDRVVLIEQFRAGAIEAAAGAWLIEAPAGLCEPGETPRAVARRELFEECGLEAGRLEKICVYRSSPGSTTEAVTAFIAEVTAPAAAAIHGQAAEHEDILAHPLPAEEAFCRLHDGRITAVTAIVPLLWLETHRARLRREWAGIG
jgi:ADP-ribose pyrophosphatase